MLKIQIKILYGNFWRFFTSELAISPKESDNPDARLIQ